MIVDIDRLVATIEEIVADEIVSRFRMLLPSDVREKKPGDLVTVADEAAERRLTAALSELLPGSIVVGEESVAADHGVQDRIDLDDPVWIIDPLDGTQNFAHGRPRYCTIVALAVGGRTVVGVIHDPNGRRTAVAEAGEGARLAGEVLAVPTVEGPLSMLAGGLTIPGKSSPLHEGYSRLAGALGRHKRNSCAGIDYIEATLGEVPVVAFKNLHPWDHAAGVLVHKEAGGVSRLLDGRDYRPTLRQGPLLVAPNQRLWDEARAAIGEVNF